MFRVTFTYTDSRKSSLIDDDTDLEFRSFEHSKYVYIYENCEVSDVINLLTNDLNFYAKLNADILIQSINDSEY